MGDKINTIIGFGGFAVGLVGIGYAIGTRKKMHDICNKLDMAIDELLNDVSIDIPTDIIDHAVNKAVEREVDHAVYRATNEVITSTKYTIRNEVSTAVKATYSDIKESVSKEVAQKVSKIDMDDLAREIREKAEEKVVEKFDDNLDDLLEKFNHNLENISKIYDSMSNTVRKSNEKEMTFRLS